MFELVKSQLLVAAWSKSQVCNRLLLGLQDRIPPGAWMSVSCECYVLSSSGLCNWLIPCLEESYYVCVCTCMHACMHTQVLLLYCLYVQCVLSAHCITLHTDMHACAQCTFWMKLKGKHEIVPCPYLFILCQTGLLGGIPFTPGRRSYKV